jgi:hypothetical protein
MVWAVGGRRCVGVNKEKRCLFPPVSCAGINAHRGRMSEMFHLFTVRQASVRQDFMIDSLPGPPARSAMTGAAMTRSRARSMLSMMGATT